MLGPYHLDSIIIGNAQVMAKAIPDESVDLVITDPPFGLGFNYQDLYQDSPKDYESLIRWIIDESNRVIKPSGLIFVFQAMPRLREVWKWFPEKSRIFSACKTFGQIYKNKRVQYRFDPVLFWQKEPCDPDGNGRDWHVSSLASATHNRGVGDASWHPCPRPLDTITYMVEQFCQPGGTIVDWFMGSGTTAVAAKMLGRYYVGFEIVNEWAEKSRIRVNLAPSPLPFDEPEQLVFMESTS